MLGFIRGYQSVVGTHAIGLSLLMANVPAVRAEQTAAKITAEQQQQLDEAKKLNSQAVKLYGAGKIRDAIVVAKQALVIRQKILGDEHLETASSLNTLGFLLLNQGQYAAARPYLEQSLKIRRKVLGEDDADTARTLNHLGYLLQGQGDYAAARSYYEQALKIRKKILGDDHGDTAQTLNNLGDLLESQGDHAAARPFLEQSLRIRRKVLGDEHPDTAESLNQLGHLLQAQGDYAAARPRFEEALKIYKKVMGDEHPATAFSLGNLASLLSTQGDYAAAGPRFEEALRIYRKALGNEHPATIMSLNNMGGLFKAQRDYASARPYLEESLKLNKKVLGDEHPYTAASLNSVGTLFMLQEDFAAARPHLEEALRINRKVFGDDHPTTAQSLDNLGHLLQAQGDYAAARPYCEQAFKIYKKLMGDDHPDTAISLYNRMTLEMAAGNVEEAAQLTEQSRRGRRRHIARVLPSLSEKEQQYYWEENDRASYYIALSLGRLHRQVPKIAALSAGWLLNGKGVGHAALAEQTLLTRDLTNPKLEDTIQEMVETRQRLARLAMSAPKPGQEAARRAALDKLTADETRLARELTEKTGRAVETDPWVDLPRVRKALPTDSVLIDIARFKVFNYDAKGKEEKYQPARYVAWIIPAADQGEVQIVDLGPADVIETAVEAARETIQAATKEKGLLKQQGEEAAEKQARQDLQKVADLVWKPLADKLGAAKQVIVSPDGALWLVPWVALPVAEDKVLLEAYPLRYVISGRDVVHADAAVLTRSAPVVFADPNFDSSAQETRQAIQAVFPDKKLDDSILTRGTMSQTALPRVARLPSTANEAQAITPNINRIAKQKTQTYTDHYALESVFKTVQRPSLLVLSTHGFFLPDQVAKQANNGVAASGTHAAPSTVRDRSIENPLLRCGLLLAGCNSQQSIAGDDGILTGMEIVGVDLRGTDLVVLSACETGIGKIRNGEGVAGLRQAFQLAGAKAVVATLWQVPDRDSMLIMNDFFQNLADGQSKTDALRNAQLKRIQARRDKNGAAHPFLWAAWTLTGE